MDVSGELVGIGIFQCVDLVEDQERGDVSAADVGEDLDDGLELLLGVGMGDVEHVQQQVGVDGFFQRRLEAGDEVVRQVADEADGVGAGGTCRRRARASSGGSWCRAWRRACRRRRCRRRSAC